MHQRFATGALGGLLLFGLVVMISSSTTTKSAVVETNEAGKKFLEENAKKADIHQLEDGGGVQYRVTVPGYGVWIPKATANVVVHYEVQTLKGKTVDYTKESLQTYVSDIVVPAIRDVVLHMVQGDEWEVFIPAERGYEVLPAGVKPGDVLKAYVQLIAIPTRSKYHMTRTLKCNLRTKENCTPLELEYATNMYEGQHNHPEAMRGEVIRLNRELNEDVDSTKDVTWWETKIFLMEQLYEMEVVRLRENSPKLEL